ncbi:Putative uncharacterized protein [Halomonas sp. R57-5]|nr:Putative uncharacterized protein [Halomonas sp. R57-5]
MHLTITPVLYAPLAQMAELVDALASGASVRMDVEVQVLFWAPNCFYAIYLYKQDGAKAGGNK